VPMHACLPAPSVRPSVVPHAAADAGKWELGKRLYCHPDGLAVTSRRTAPVCRARGSAKYACRAVRLVLAPRALPLRETTDRGARSKDDGVKVGVHPSAGSTATGPGARVAGRRFAGTRRNTITDPRELHGAGTYERTGDARGEGHCRKGRTHLGHSHMRLNSPDVLYVPFYLLARVSLLHPPGRPSTKNTLIPT
jgi:hypothetical protein